MLMQYTLGKVESVHSQIELDSHGCPEGKRDRELKERQESCHTHPSRDSDWLRQRRAESNFCS